MRLEVDKLGVTSGGSLLLNDVSFSLSSGERLAVVGMAAAGKSILARAIAGLLPPSLRTAGAVRLDGAAIERKLLGSKIGLLLPEADKSLDPTRTIAAQIGANADLLKDAGFDASIGARYPRQLTAGERRIIAVGLALAPRPELLIADDPVAGLDLATTRRIVEMIRKHCTERNMALLLITHDLKLAAELGTHVLVLAAGKMAESGTKDEVFGHPRHDLTKRMMTAGRHRSKALMRAPIGGTLLDVRKVGCKVPAPGAALRRRPADLTVLDDVSFSIRAGESMVLTGASGSGKSTLARIIAGLAAATSGELELDNTVYHGSDLPAPMRREISFVFRNPAQSFNPRLTMGESITEPLRLDALKPMDELDARIVELVQAVGLKPEMLAMTPDVFPMAHLQRFAIARALMTGPQLVVFDDPTAMLDVVARGMLLTLLNRLRADFALTFLTVTHDIEMAKFIADRVIVLDGGRLVETGAPATLFDKPEHPATQKLVAAALPEVGIVPVA